jgi:hypothetical protein
MRLRVTFGYRPRLRPILPKFNVVARLFFAYLLTSRHASTATKSTKSSIEQHEFNPLYSGTIHFLVTV